MEDLERLIALGLLLMAVAVGCSPATSSRETALLATVEALRNDVAQLQAEGTAPTGLAEPAAPTPGLADSENEGGRQAARPDDWWVANHRATTMWSASDGGKALAMVRQWSYFLVMEPQAGSRLHLFIPGGQGNGYVGDGWVAAADLGPVQAPSDAAVDKSALPGRQVAARWEPVAPSPSVGPPALAPDRIDYRLLDWRPVNQSDRAGDLQLNVNSLLLGEGSYGGPFGSRISATQETRIVLADVSLGHAFRAGASPVEVHVDFLVIGDSAGVEYRGLPVPIGNALPERFFLSPGQTFRGVVAFIVPRELRSGRLYFTNFLGRRDPPERLTVYLQEIP